MVFFLRLRKCVKDIYDEDLPLVINGQAPLHCWARAANNELSPLNIVRPNVQVDGKASQKKMPSRHIGLTIY